MEKETLLPEEFFSRIRKGASIIEGHRISLTIPFHAFQSQWKIEFKDCLIDLLEVNGARLADVTFRECTLRNISFQNEKGIQIHIYQCSTDNNSKGQEDQMYQFSVLNSGVTFIEIKTNSYLKDLKVVGRSGVDESRTTRIDIEDSTIDSLEIQGQNVDKLNLKGGFESIISTTTNILECFIKSEKQIQKLQLKGKKCGTFQIENTECSSIYLEFINITTIKFDNSSFDKFVVESDHVVTINILDTQNRESGLLELNIHQLNSFYLSSVSLDSLIFGFEQDKTNWVIVKLVIEKTTIKKEIDLSDLKIDNLEFNILKIKKAALKIHNIQFSQNKVFRNVEWATQNRAYEFDSSKFKNKDEYVFQLKTLKETYRDLKVHFLGHSNYFDAMLFSTNELRIEEKIKRAETWRMSLTSFKDNVGDWLVLYTNSTFGNFGLSWIRPLIWWLFVFHLVSLYFILINFNIGIEPAFTLYPFSWEGIDWAATWEGFYLYLKLLFPVHDSDVIITLNDTVKRTNIWGVWDFLIRVFASYFIFLVIRGTRKFNFKVGS